MNMKGVDKMVIWATLILIFCIACVLVLYGALAVFSDVDDLEERYWEKRNNGKGNNGKEEDREDG